MKYHYDKKFKSGTHLLKQVTNHMKTDDTEKIAGQAYHLIIPAEVTSCPQETDWANILNAINVKIRKSFGFYGERKSRDKSKRIGIVTGLDFAGSRYVETFDAKNPLTDPHFHSVILLPTELSLSQDIKSTLLKELRSLREVRSAIQRKSGRRKISLEKISGGGNSLAETLDYSIKATTKCEDHNFIPPYRIFPYHRDNRVLR